MFYLLIPIHVEDTRRRGHDYASQDVKQCADLFIQQKWLIFM